jgi:ribonuclease BN (tRNA processing enzyme)
MLKFLGTGSAFNTDLGNNSGYSYLGEDLLLIDCGGLVFHKIQKLKLLDNAKELYVIITHTHPDHVGSLGDLIFYNYYILKKKINIIFPEKELLTLYLRSIGALESMYNLFEKAPETAPFKLVFIKVKHVDTIPTYGFIFKASEENFYYSGDSNELSEVILNHFVKCEIDKIFQDTCGIDYPGNAHLCIDKLEKLIPKEFRSRVFCMHRDASLDVEKVKELGFQLATSN